MNLLHPVCTGLLQEEESVLAQEAILDVLVRSEQGHWPAWDSDNHLSVVGCCEAADQSRFVLF